MSANRLAVLIAALATRTTWRLRSVPGTAEATWRTRPARSRLSLCAPYFGNDCQELDDATAPRIVHQR